MTAPEMTADEINVLWSNTLRHGDPTAGDAHIRFARALLAQPVPPASAVTDARRYQWLRDRHDDRHEGVAEACCVFAPNDMHECLVPVGSLPGQLDAFIDAAIASLPQTQAAQPVQPVVSDSDELRRAVRQITQALNDREWAEHVSTDPDALELESAITDMHNELTEALTEALDDD